MGKALIEYAKNGLLSKKNGRGFTCPSCEQDFIKEQVGTVTNLIGGWYCEKENLGVCYMLCPSCSQVAAYGTVTQQEKQEQVINKNLLDAWIKTK